MNKILIHIALTSFGLSAFCTVTSQSLEFFDLIDNSTIPTESISYDYSTFLNVVNELEEERGIAPLGEAVSVDYSMLEHGSLINNKFEETGVFMYAMNVSVNQASKINLYLADLNLKENDQIYIGIPGDQSSYDQLDTRELLKRSHFATYPIESNILQIIFQCSSELYEAPFVINRVGVFNSSERGDGDCHVDVNCTEGDEWNSQTDAVVRLLVTQDGVIFSCTGTLMNNTSGDKRRLILSALHCMDEATAEELNTAIVTFNYENSDCNSSDASETNFLVGLDKLADSNDAVDGQSNPSGSDFILLEIQDEIPVEWNPYWAGWNAANQVSSSGVTLHHASGDEKKVSTYNSAIVSTFIGAPGSHWGVQWIGTSNGHGVTEPGSSGSPLFNSNGQVIGTLTGGFSACEESGNNGPNEQDYFGKLSYHWLNNPNTPDQKLKVWLDPINTGQLSLDGSYDPIMSIYHDTTIESGIEIFPSVCSDIVNINILNSSLKWKSFKVINTSGSTIMERKISGNVNTLHVTSWSEGVYILALYDVDGNSFIRKLVKY